MPGQIVDGARRTHGARWCPLARRPISCGLLLAALLAPRLPMGEPRLGPINSYSVEVKEGAFAYLVDKGGDVDYDNGVSRVHDGWQLAALSDVALEIENLGSSPVRDPKVVVNGRRDWWSTEAIVRQALAGAEDPQERALAVWDLMRRNLYHDAPLFEAEGGDELHDPVKLLSIYGAGLCDDMGRASTVLYRAAGLDRAHTGADPYVRHLHGHMMSEVKVAGAWRFLDIDRDVFYLDRDGRQLVSGDAVSQDHYLAKRTYHFGPGPQPWVKAERAASLFGADDGTTAGAREGAGLHYALRPGERLTYLWIRDGAFPSSAAALQHKIAANALFSYDTARARLQADTTADAALQWRDGLPAAGDKAASLQLPFALPYPLAGGELAARFALEPQAEVEVALTHDGRRYQTLCRLSLPGEQPCTADLAAPLEVKQPPAKYRYAVRVTMRRARLLALRVDSNTLVSLAALPHLALGRNEVRYTDAGPGPRHVRVTHLWREVRAQTVAAPVLELPADDEVVAADTVEFRWQATPGADLYHFYLSRGDALRFPFRPAFDRYVVEPVLRHPHWGIFRPDETYRWMVRARSSDGVWGPWSDAHRLRWRGPMAPRSLIATPRGDEIVLGWEASAEGEPPVAYEVYASNERGFTPSPTARQVLGRGEVGSNLVARVEETQLVASTPRPQHPGQNRCYWRVVALDAAGVRSAPSEAVELPQPKVVVPPSVRAAAGAEVQVPFWIIHSLGDLQHRPTAKPPERLWDAAPPEVEISGAPSWLHRSDVGLSGVAPASAKGSWTIAITARAAGRSDEARVRLVTQ